jgi:hypothetical protein
VTAFRGLLDVSLPDLLHLVSCIERGAVVPPLTATRLQSVNLGRLSGELGWLATLDRPGVLALLRAIIAERTSRPVPRLELVWTGPEATVSPARDTAVVVRDLFERAMTSVLVAGFSFDHGAELLEPLHRAVRDRGVDAAIYLHIEEHGEALRFLQRNWPFGPPVPRLYHDPRTIGPKPLANLHAKCVVVDARYSFVSSANFTDRGHTRNIEVGVLIEDASFAGHLLGQWQRATDAGLFLPCPIHQG